MTRVALLRVGYAALGLAILLLTGAFVPQLGFLVLLSPIVAVAGAIALAFSDDEIPKWAGIAFLVYAAAMLIAFIAATPATIRLSFFKGFFNSEPSRVAQAILEYLGLALPIMVAATALVAAWERENPARALLAGALVGIVAVAVLTIALNPDLGPVASGGNSSGVTAEEIARAQSEASSQAGLLKVLAVLTAVAGAAGAWWAAARPEEYR